MIIIRLEMWPRGDHTRARSLGVATVANMGGDAKVGHYEAILFKAPEYSKHAETRPLHEMLTRPKAKEIWKKAYVEGFPRLRLGPWDLLFRALGAMVARRNPDVDLRSLDEASLDAIDAGHSDAGDCETHTDSGADRTCGGASHEGDPHAHDDREAPEHAHPGEDGLRHPPMVSEVG